MTGSMDRTINRVKLIFVGVFAVLCVGVVVWQVGWAMPRKACEEQRKWWDNSERVCAQPVLTSDITGRMITDDKAREEALRALGRLPPETPAKAAPVAK